MQRKEVFLKTTKTARITELKSEHNHNPFLLIALHGYGQLSTYFSRKFEQATQLGFDVLVPEGLNRFYLEGSSGRVGASWMTKELREDDMADNKEYLFQVISNYRTQYEKIVLLGFSQGGATAARVFFDTKIKLDGLILWACVFPPDICIELTHKSVENCFFIIGKSDPYFIDSKQKEILTLHHNMGFVTETFEGEHEIHPETLASVLQKL